VVNLSGSSMTDSVIPKLSSLARTVDGKSVPARIVHPIDDAEEPGLKSRAPNVPGLPCHHLHAGLSQSRESGHGIKNQES